MEVRLRRGAEGGAEPRRRRSSARGGGARAPRRGGRACGDEVGGVEEVDSPTVRCAVQEADEHRHERRVVRDLRAERRVVNRIEESTKEYIGANEEMKNSRKKEMKNGPACRARAQRPS